ncbi:MAG: CRISPR-associated endoribonuclease Cas6 [Lachnospiraceae bacterium]|nr:CRISPR-associated endoribonuclease Cas6 [Lachnospiraceae bacterium]
MQGVLFEHIESGYAQYLHTQSMHPYSQYIVHEDQKTVWIIQTLNKEAYQEVVLPLLDSGFRDIHLKKAEEEYSITSKKVETIEKKELLEEFYRDDYDDFFQTDFLSSTAFKKNGRYYILPDVRLVFQNLMNKYSATSERVDMVDEEMLGDIEEHVFVSRHRIQSTIFPIEGVNIPGFMGKVIFRVKSNHTLKRYIRLLLRFGEYSGIGIKTAMGMGAFRVNRGMNCE